MESGLPELPEWVETRLDVNQDYEVQDHHIVASFLEADAAYLSVSQVASRIDMTTQGTRNRLEHLEEVGVLDSKPAANGRIYWIADDRSEWPIPPDVAVEPVEEGVTVRDLLSRTHVRAAIGAVIIGVLSTILFLSGIVLNLLVGQEPFVLAVFQLGLLAAVLLVLFGVGSLVLWVRATLR